jgi:glutathione S-transferase
MKLYVCHGTFKNPLRPGGHPCGNAYEALKEAGHDPEVVKARGLGPLPDFLQPRARREIKEMTGSPWVPVLVTDDGEVISESKEIVAWAEAHPAGG